VVQITRPLTSTTKESYSTKVSKNRIITVNKDGTTFIRIVNKNINDFMDSDLFQKNHIAENTLIKDSIKEVTKKLIE
jgi:hypothetical protein